MKFPTARTLLSNGAPSAVAISADGTALAVLAGDAIEIRRVDGVPLRFTAPPSVVGLYWLLSKPILIVESEVGLDTMLWRLKLIGPSINKVNLEALDGSCRGVVRAAGDSLVLACLRPDAGGTDLWRLSPDTEHFGPVWRNPGNVISWAVNAAGLVIAAAAATYDGGVEILRPSGRGLQAVTQFPAGTGGQLYPTPDGTTILSRSSRHADCAALVRVDLETGTEIAVSANAAADLAGAVTCIWSDRLLASTFTTHGRYETCPLDPTFSSRWAQIESAVGGDIAIAAHDATLTRILIHVDSDVEPGISFLAEPGRELSELARSLPMLDRAQLRRTRPIWVRARDGLELPCLFTDSLHQRQPLVVLLHGGPWDRDVWEFDPLVQFFATRGCGVLQVNYRGSTGFGKRFMDRGFDHGVDGMVGDVLNATAYVIETQDVDGSRVAAVGGSFGGYLAVATALHRPEAFRAACSVNGPTDLAALVGTFGAEFQPLLAGTWGRFRDLNAKTLTGLATDLSSDTIAPAVALLHSKNDERVPYHHAEDMARDLAVAGVDVVLHEIRGTHDLRDAGAGEEALRLAGRFLAGHLQHAPLAEP